MCPRQLLNTVLHLKEGFQQANLHLSKKFGVQISQPSPVRQPIEKRTWTKPSGSQLNTNWDAAINSTMNYSGFGGLVRDSVGEVLASFSNCYLTPLPPLLGLSNVIFKGDCLQLIQVVQGD